MQSLRSFLYDFLRRNALAAGSLLVLDILANLLIVGLSITAAQVYTGLLGMGSARGRLLAEFGIGEHLVAEDWLWVFGGLVLLRAGADWGRSALRGIIGEGFSLALRRRLFSHQLALERKHYTEKGAGRYLLRFSGDLNSVQSLFTRGVLRTLGDLTLVSSSLALFFYLDATLGGIVLAALLVLSTGLLLLNRAAGRLDGRRRDRKSGLLAYVSRHLPFVAAVQATNRERPVREAFNRRAVRLAEVGRRYWLRAAGVAAIVPLGIHGGLWLVLFVLSRRDGVGLDPNMLLIFILLLLSWRPVLGRLLRVGLTWKKGMISLRKLANLLDRSVEQISPAKDVRIDASTLELKNLSFGYGERMLFTGLNLKLKPTEFRLLVAGSGGGKTSLVRLLAGCARPTAGTIRQGAYTLADTNLKSWRRNLAFVSPAFPLFGATLKEALCYSRRKKYRRAAASLFKEWQVMFPLLRNLQLSRRLGDNCSNLTGGQVTLMLWLRAILAGKPLLVVDEGLVGLDEETRTTLLNWLHKQREAYGILWLDHPDNVVEKQFGARARVLGEVERPKNFT